MRTVVIAIAAGLIAIFARTHLDGAQLPLADVRAPLPAELRIATLNFDSLAADVLWIRFIQNVPDTHADPVLGEWLGRQLSAVVELDPHFRASYLGGTVLLDVLADQPCESLRILEGGIRRFPLDWRMRLQAGFICFAELSDTPCAVTHLRAAAASPEGPKWLPGLVGRLLAESSQTEAAIEYLRVELARTTDPRLRVRFSERLQEAYLTHDLEKIGAALRTWRLRNEGSVPASLQVLVAEGLLPSVPAADPFGGHYEIGPDGNVRSTSGKVALRAHRNDSPFYDSVEERLTEERVLARLPATLQGNPPWLLFPVDRLHAASGHFEYVAKALEVLDATDPDELRTKERLGLKARLLLRVEVEKLRASHLVLLRDDPARTWSIADIRRHAGVPAADPFGGPYRLDAKGRPSADSRRRSLMLMNEGEGGSRACR